MAELIFRHITVLEIRGFPLTILELLLHRPGTALEIKGFSFIGVVLLINFLEITGCSLR